MSVSGIYRINGPNGKFYVGSARNIGQRWTEHKRDLRYGDHGNSKLQRSWNRHGETGFTIEVLEVVSLPDDLIKREQFWIDSLKAVVNGYNILPVAGSSLGRKHSDETRRKMSAAKLEAFMARPKLTLKQKKLKVLDALRMSNQLSRAQLSWGPLRHVSQEDREKVLRGLAREKLVKKVEVKPSSGPIAVNFRITEAGRKFGTTDSAQQ